MQRTASLATRITIFKTIQSSWVADFTCKSRFAGTVVAIDAINAVPMNARVTGTVIEVIFTVYTWIKKEGVRGIRRVNLSKKATKLFSQKRQIKNPTCFKVTLGAI